MKTAAYEAVRDYAVEWLRKRKIRFVMSHFEPACGFKLIDAQSTVLYISIQIAYYDILQVNYQKSFIYNLFEFITFLIHK